MEAIPSRPYRFSFCPQPVGSRTINGSNSILPGPTIFFFCTNLYGQEGLIEAIPSRPYRFYLVPKLLGARKDSWKQFLPGLQVLFLEPTCRAPGQTLAPVFVTALTKIMIIF
jgi:hypothetical protein